MTTLEELHDASQQIFTHALEECSVARAFDRHIRFEGSVLVRQPSPLVQAERIDLQTFKKVYVIAFGKAARTMMKALLARLPGGLRVRGVCSAPMLPARRNWRFRFFTGGHPLPTAQSFAAARAALALLARARKDTFVIFLISGGGSAMFELPLDPSISEEDAIAFHETLIASGATITEVNTLRMRFSAVKGGRLALAADASEKLTLLVADVPLKDLGLVASSPTLPDRSSEAEVQQILARYDLLPRFPQSVREFFERPRAAADGARTTASFARSHLEVLLSNHDFVNAARDHAKKLGFKVVIDNTCDDWDYADAAAYLLERFHALRREHARLCLLSSGEVTVRLNGEPGCGGRNQQFALTCAMDLARYSGQNLAVLSAGSDGIDGNSPAAGAIADMTTVQRAHEQGFDPAAELARFNTCPLFTALGDSMVTGPTGNNLRDLRIFLSA